MPDNKFEPFQRELVRHRNYEEWLPMLYGFEKDKGHMCGMFQYSQCIPYTDETAHLLGTTQPYEPPNPPVEYEWGQKVEVLKNHVWAAGIVSYIETGNEAAAVVIKGEIHASLYPPDRIRPLTT